MYSCNEAIVPAEAVCSLERLEPTRIELNWELSPPVNGFCLFVDSDRPKHKTIARHLGGDMWLAITPAEPIHGLTSRDKHQAAFLDCLLNDDIGLSVGIGPAGTGKTTLALGYALRRWELEDKRIVLSKSTAMVGKGRAFGPVPGTEADKYAPFLNSYKIILRKLYGSRSESFFDGMQKKKHLQFRPVEFVRGDTYENCTFILDEAQNLEWHELNTLVSRIGEGSKLIVLGDLNQIDTRMRRTESGLYKLISAPPFQYNSISSCNELVTQYRSPMCALAAEVDSYVRGD